METQFKRAQIILDEPRAIYYAGQLLNGHIECDLALPLKFTGINITFLGKAVVGWSETETEENNGISRQKEIQYKGREEYFNQTLPIYGSGFVNTLPSGTHKFPFQYQIPYNVPSTYRSQCGNVTYTITVYIDYPDPSMERTKLVKEFEVVAPLELNNEEGKRPTELEVEELYSCCCSLSPMSLSIRLPVTGYCPGQAIPITVSARNDTNSEVKTIIFQLVKKVGYRALTPRSELTPPEEVLETKKTGAIMSNSNREFTVDLIVPDMIAPNLDNCDIIDMGFGLKVTAKLSGCNDDLEDETEIILGLVPIPGTPGSETYKHPLASDLPNAPIPVAPAPVLNTVSHPNSNAGFPSNPGYPNSNPGYPTSNPGYPNSNPGYPNSNPGYPNSNPGYPNSSTGYPNANPGYPPAYPHSARAPGSDQAGEIPLKAITNQGIGFIVPVSPTSPANPPPYSQIHATPYPPAQNYFSAPSAPPS